jgi:hypothetical protein
MIEQTELVVDEWIYIPPLSSVDKISSKLELDVMRKSAPNKKGLAFRFTCRFMSGNETILLYIGQDSYVIDLEDKVDRNEVLRMIRNSYTKFQEKYDIRKLGTVLHNTPLNLLNEAGIQVDAIVDLIA